MVIRFFAKLKLVNIGGLVPIGSQRELHEKSDFTYFAVQGISVKDGLTVKGHFQHWKYVENIWPRVESEIFATLDEIDLDRKLIDLFNYPTIAVHIRGGDYLIPKISEIYGQLPTVYYRLAIKLAMEQLESPANIIVLTNDLVFAKETISESEYPSVIFLDPGEFSVHFLGGVDIFVVNEVVLPSLHNHGFVQILLKLRLLFHTQIFIE